MQTVNDTKFLGTLKLRIDRTIYPKYLNHLLTANVNTVTDFVTLLSGMDVSICMQKELKLDSLPSLDQIYGKLLSCWIKSLEHLTRTANPSEKIKEVMYTYLSKYIINAVFYSLLNRATKLELPYPLNQEISFIIAESKDFMELSSKLKKLRRKDTTLVIKTLSNYSKKRIEEVSPYVILNEMRSEYWKKLAEALNKAGAPMRVLSCVEKSRILDQVSHSVRKALTTGQDYGKTLTPLNPKEQELIGRAGKDLSRLEATFSFLGVAYCDDSLTLLPLGIGTLLHYLILKDWETLFVSHVLYSLKMGYGYDYVKRLIERWLWVYEFIHQ